MLILDRISWHGVPAIFSYFKWEMGCTEINNMIEDDQVCCMGNWLRYNSIIPYFSVMEPLPVESDHSDDEWVDEDDDGDEELVPSEPARCLFCDSTFPNPESVFSHCRTNHGFRIAAYLKQHQLDCFGYIKMVNYCRKEVGGFISKWQPFCLKQKKNQHIKG